MTLGLKKTSPMVESLLLTTEGVTHFESRPTTLKSCHRCKRFFFSKKTKSSDHRSCCNNNYVFESDPVEKQIPHRIQKLRPIYEVLKGLSTYSSFSTGENDISRAPSNTLHTTNNTSDLSFSSMGDKTKPATEKITNSIPNMVNKTDQPLEIVTTSTYSPSNVVNKTSEPPQKLTSSVPSFSNVVNKTSQPTAATKTSVSALLNKTDHLLQTTKKCQVCYLTTNISTLSESTTRSCGCNLTTKKSNTVKPTTRAHVCNLTSRTSTPTIRINSTSSAPPCVTKNTERMSTTTSCKVKCAVFKKPTCTPDLEELKRLREKLKKYGFTMAPNHIKNRFPYAQMNTPDFTFEVSKSTESQNYSPPPRQINENETLKNPLVGRILDFPYGIQNSSDSKNQGELQSPQKNYSYFGPISEAQTISNFGILKLSKSQNNQKTANGNSSTATWSFFYPNNLEKKVSNFDTSRINQNQLFLTVPYQHYRVNPTADNDTENTPPNYEIVLHSGDQIPRYTLDPAWLNWLKENNITFVTPTAQNANDIYSGHEPQPCRSKQYFSSNSPKDLQGNSYRHPKNRQKETYVNNIHLSSSSYNILHSLEWKSNDPDTRFGMTTVEMTDPDGYQQVNHYDNSDEGSAVMNFTSIKSDATREHATPKSFLLVSKWPKGRSPPNANNNVGEISRDAGTTQSHLGGGWRRHPLKDDPPVCRTTICHGRVQCIESCRPQSCPCAETTTSSSFRAAPVSTGSHDVPKSSKLENELRQIIFDIIQRCLHDQGATLPCSSSSIPDPRKELSSRENQSSSIPINLETTVPCSSSEISNCGMEQSPVKHGSPCESTTSNNFETTVPCACSDSVSNVQNADRFTPELQKMITNIIRKCIYNDVPTNLCSSSITPDEGTKTPSKEHQESCEMTPRNDQSTPVPCLPSTIPDAGKEECESTLVNNSTRTISFPCSLSPNLNQNQTSSISEEPNQRNRLHEMISNIIHQCLSTSSADADRTLSVEETTHPCSTSVVDYEAGKNQNCTLTKEDPSNPFPAIVVDYEASENISVGESKYPAHTTVMDDEAGENQNCTLSTEETTNPCSTIVVDYTAGDNPNCSKIEEETTTNPCPTIVGDFKPGGYKNGTLSVEEVTTFISSNDLGDDKTATLKQKSIELNSSYVSEVPIPISHDPVHPYPQLRADKLKKLETDLWKTIFNIIKKRNETTTIHYSSLTNVDFETCQSSIEPETNFQLRPQNDSQTVTPAFPYASSQKNYFDHCQPPAKPGTSSYQKNAPLSSASISESNYCGCDGFESPTTPSYPVSIEVASVTDGNALTPKMLQGDNSIESSVTASPELRDHENDEIGLSTASRYRAATKVAFETYDNFFTEITDEMEIHSEEGDNALENFLSTPSELIDSESNYIEPPDASSYPVSTEVACETFDSPPIEITSSKLLASNDEIPLIPSSLIETTVPIAVENLPQPSLKVPPKNESTSNLTPPSYKFHSGSLLPRVHYQPLFNTLPPVVIEATTDSEGDNTRARTIPTVDLYDSNGSFLGDNLMRAPRHDSNTLNDFVDSERFFIENQKTPLRQTTLRPYRRFNRIGSKLFRSVLKPVKLSVDTDQDHAVHAQG